MLSDYLYSKKGGKYKSRLIFNGTLRCKDPAPNIVASSSDMVFYEFPSSRELISGINVVDDLITAKNFSSKVFMHGRVYALKHIFDNTITYELIQNLVLAIICVFVLTFIFLSNFSVSCMVLVCVLFTLINLIGILYLWNISINVLTCGTIIVSVGICVDYSAHIAHAFTVSSGKTCTFLIVCDKYIYIY